MNCDKALKKSISLPEYIVIESEKKARETTNGNLSLYIQNLINRDIGVAPALPTEKGTIIDDLATRWTPTFSDVLKHFLKESDVDQIEILGRFLSKLNDYLAAHSGGHSEDFILLPRRKVLRIADAQEELGALKGKKYRLALKRVENPALNEEIKAKEKIIAEAEKELLESSRRRPEKNAPPEEN